MRKHFVAGMALAVFGLVALPAIAADKDKKDEKGPFLRYQHTYAAALEEASDRGCVIFATFHIDH